MMLLNRKEGEGKDNTYSFITMQVLGQQEKDSILLETHKWQRSEERNGIARKILKPFQY